MIGDVPATNERQRAMDDRELVARLAARDAEGFSALFTLYVPRMIAYATSLLGSPEAGDDAVADLIEKWFKRPPTIGGPLVPFLLRSVKNAVIDAERRRKKETGQHPRTTSGLAAPDRRMRGPLVQKAPAETDEEFDALCAEAFATLSASDREVLELGTRTMTTKEKAAELKKTVAALNKQLHDARGRLVKAVEVARASRARVD